MFKKISLYILMTLAALSMIIPLLWMVSTSLKNNQLVFQMPPRMIPEDPTLDSYHKLFDLFPMMRMLMNSILVSIVITGGQIATSLMAAYAFARMSFKGKDAVFLVFLATMMVPFQVTIIPLFVLMRSFGWLNSYPGLTVPLLHTAFGVFLLRQALMTIPHELEESAFMDGANHWQVFSRIIAPLTKASVATLLVLSFMASWNSFLWPLIVTRSDDMMTLPVGLSVLRGRYETKWNMVMAGGVISIIPIVVVFLFSQKHFIQGISRSGIKN
ncbi:MAG: carbohydrate ABC transporter permease [Spirochaetales bacterium]|nr:carbohydrate ABC transporter permease [Spirochaetales bacterium]